jgi:hypothetical protein
MTAVVVKARKNARTRRRLPVFLNLIAETSGANFSKEAALQFLWKQLSECLPSKSGDRQNIAARRESYAEEMRRESAKSWNGEKYLT